MGAFDVHKMVCIQLGDSSSSCLLRFYCFLCVSAYRQFIRFVAFIFLTGIILEIFTIVCLQFI